MRPTLALLLLAFACKNPAAPAPAPAADAPHPAPPTPSPAASPAVPATAPPALPADACATDADCGFEDGCAPQRCLLHPPRAANQVCGASRPPTGTCVCFHQQCAFQPGPSDPPVKVAGTCTVAVGCTLDVAAGRCTPGPPGPMGFVGPRCDCLGKPARCTFAWLAPVACTTDDDCWVAATPSPHPIARPKAKRGHAFRCTDGELAPACAQGQCTLGHRRCAG